MKNGQEVWKTIKEFPTYSVSNFGRVKNDKRNYILHGGYDNDGYRQVTLSYNGKQYNRRVCRLVAITFIPNPKELPQVNHKDEDKENDCVDNLEWCNALYNNNYGERTQKTRKRVRCVETKTIYEGVRVAARLLHTSHNSISKACKTDGICRGYHWEYVNTEGE